MQIKHGLHSNAEVKKPVNLGGPIELFIDSNLNSFILLSNKLLNIYSLKTGGRNLKAESLCS